MRCNDGVDHPPPPLRGGRAGEGGRAVPESGYAPDLDFIAHSGNNRDNHNGSARPPTLTLPHKSLRPGARKRGPGGGGDP
jgi:hypothetical protein